MKEWNDMSIASETDVVLVGNGEVVWKCTCVG